MPWIDKDKCTGCGLCIRECPVKAISLKKEKAEINQNKCIKCGKCLSVCPQDAIRPNSENPNLRGQNSSRPGRGLGMRRGFGRRS